MEILFFDRRYFFDRIITTTMNTDTIEKHDVRCSSSELYNLIYSMLFGTYSTSIPILHSRIFVFEPLFVIYDLDVKFFSSKTRECQGYFNSSATVKLY